MRGGGIIDGLRDGEEHGVVVGVKVVAGERGDRRYGWAAVITARMGENGRVERGFRREQEYKEDG